MNQWIRRIQFLCKFHHLSRRFTLYDLYSYNEKHNENNGWNNTDGASDNRSWNCGPRRSDR